MLDRIRAYFKLLGFKGGIDFAIGLIRHRTVYIFVAEPRKNIKALEKLINPELDVRLITDAAGFDSIIEDYAMAKSKLLALRDREQITSGRQWLGVVYRQGQFAGWGWVKKGPIRFGSCQLTGSDCAIVKCRTLRNHRRHRVYVTLMARLQQKLADMGFQKVYGYSIPFNKASLGGIAKVGFELVEECDRGSFVSRLIRKTLGKPPKLDF